MTPSRQAAAICHANGSCRSSEGFTHSRIAVLQEPGILGVACLPVAYGSAALIVKSD
jgi:hypothetical protein